MRQPHPLVKSLALISSTLLLCGFVAYRSNPIGRWSVPADYEAVSIESDLIAVAPEGSSVAFSPVDGGILIRNSDASISVDLPAQPSSALRSPIVNGSQTFNSWEHFPSSKGGAVLLRSVPVQTHSNAFIMSSSKSITLIPPEGESASGTVAPQQKAAVQRSK